MKLFLMMKKLLFTLAFIVGIFSTANAQFIRYNTNTGYNFGLNIGATYLDQNRSELQRYAGIAGGFTFGREYLRENAPLSLGWRFRYLRGTAYGFDNVADTSHLASNELLNGDSYSATDYDNSGNAFLNNYRTDLHEYSLEAVVTLNKLRQRTGLSLGVFGGVGIVDYRVMSDVLDVDGNQYQFTEGEVFNNYSEISSVLDGNYDAYSHANRSGTQIKFMPSLGVELGYQISPRFSLGLTHKWTWALNNGLDGVDYSTSRQEVKGNDIYHYSGLKLKWFLHKAEANVDFVDNRPDPTPTNFTNKRPPIVNFTNPYYSNHTTNQNTFNIEADVFNVSGAQQITFKQNGVVNSNFTYSPNNNEFESFVYLQPGQNVFEIIAVNEAGRDQETRVIINNQANASLPPPVVTITNPSSCPHISQDAVFNIQAQILNVSSSANVKFLHNGQSKTFSYNANTDLFYATVTLNAGNNNIQITGTNTVGSDSKSCIIVYDPIEIPQAQPPVVDIFNPSNSPYTTQNSSMAIDASVLHVNSKNDITVKVNGSNVSNFNWNQTTKLVSFTASLNPGSNYVQVVGTNQDGTDSDQVMIIYEQPQVSLPPVVTFTDPYTNPYTVYTNTYNVKAKVLHVAGKSNIQLKINGISTNNFTYSTSSKQLSVHANLIQGSNTFEVTATNNDGTDYESTTIIYTPIIIGNPPVVNITTPGSDPYNTAYSSEFISATVLNVNTASGIQVSINGQNTNNFNFNPNNGLLTFTANLVTGSNQVKVTGTNGFGSDFDQTTIIYQPIETPTPPTVDIFNPAPNPHNVSVPNINVVANTTNITSTSQVGVKLNGSNVNNFTLGANGQVSILNANLIIGSNVFEITVSNPDGSATDQTIVIYTPVEEPCDAPILSITSPTNGTTITGGSQSLSLSASVQNATQNEVMVKLNGVSKPFTMNSTGQVNANLNLQVGANTIELIAITECGTAHKTVIATYEEVQAPCHEPIIAFVSPISPNQAVEIGAFAVEASISHISSASQISFKVNGQANNNFSYDPATHTFTATIPLSLGSNSMQIVATNDCGSASSVTNIKGEACEAPVINMTNSLSSTTTATQSTINATINHVDISGAINVTVNGNNSSFNYNNGILSISAPLSIGSNTIAITANNSCGSVSETVTITRENCDEPIIQLVKPLTNPFNTTDNSINLTAYVQNVSSQSGIKVLLNGAAKTFQFSNGNGKVIFVNELNVGSNTVELIATNSCGTVTETILVNYTEEVPDPTPPVVTITTPSSAPHTVSGPVFNVKGTVTNIGSKNQMNVTVNGVNYSNFTYNPANTQFNIPLTLSANSTTQVVVSASNVDGSDSDNTSLVYNITTTGGASGSPCKGVLAPVISFTNPSSSPTTVTLDAYTMVAAVSEVSTASQVTVKMNGNVVNGSFNATSGVISASVTLAEGNNTFEILADNSCENSSASISVYYLKPDDTFGGGGSGNGGKDEETPDPCDGVGTPAISFIAPASNNEIVNNGSFTLSAYVSEVNNATEITLSVNGTNETFNYNPNNETISSNISLEEGSNQITISADNGCHSANGSISVNYDIPDTSSNTSGGGSGGNGGCIPTVGATFAANNLSTSVSSTKDLSNVVLNFEDGTHQKFDGLSGYTGTFSGTGQNNGKCIVGVWIKSGCNSSNDGPGYGEYVANNGWSGSCGGDDGSNTTCEVPVINFISPASCPFSTNSNGLLITANVQHLDGGSVTVSLNGTNVSNFTTSANGDVVINLTFIDPTNTINISASNSCGNASNSCTINVNSNGNGNGNGNNGHGNNEDGVDSSNPGQGGGGPNGTNDPSGNVDDEGANGNQDSENGNSGNTSGGNSGNGGNNGNGGGNGNGNGGNGGASGMATQGGMNGTSGQGLSNEDQSKVNDHLKKGEDFFNAGNYKSAQAEYDAALKIDPNNATAKERSGYMSKLIKAEEAKRLEENKRKADEARRKQEEAARKAEEEKKRQEAAGKAAAEEKRRQEEAARKAQEEKMRQEAAAKAAAEEKRRQEEAAKNAAEEKRRQEEAAKKAQEEKMRQEAAAKAAAEEKRRQEEAARKAAEEKRRQEEAARNAADEKRRQEEAARKAAEEKRRQEEAARNAADEKRRQEEAARKAAEEKRRQEAAARAAAEEKRRQEEAARKAAEEKRRQEEAARRAAEEKRKQEAAARAAAEEKRRQEEAARKAAEAKRRQEEAARKAAEEKRRQEAARKAAEEKRKKEEAARRAAAEKKKAEEAAAKKKAEAAKTSPSGRG